MMKILIAIIAVGVVAAVVILTRKQPDATARPVSGEPAASDDFPPKPKWKLDVPVDLDRITKAFRYYSDNKMTFAVFGETQGDALNLLTS